MKRNSQGVTLIEVLVYLGLFSVLIGGVVVSVYSMFIVSDRTGTMNMVQMEGDFLSAKIDTLLSQADSVSISGGILTVTKGTETVSIYASSTNIVLQRNGSALVLNNPDIAAENFVLGNSTSAGKTRIDGSFSFQARTPAGAMYTQDFIVTSSAH